MRLLSALSIFLLAACAAQAPVETPVSANLQLKPVNYVDLPGWRDDDLREFAPAFTNTCARLAKKNPDESIGLLPQAGTYGAWQKMCDGFARIDQTNNSALHLFFENNFMPYALTNNGDPNGLFTGYYQASLKGSKTRSARYNIPLYARPDDLVMVNLGEFREELKGQRIAGRVVNGTLKSYEDRAAIVAGRWPHNDKALVWVDDAVDAFFVQIQGSGVVEMADGTVMPIGYAGQNGHVYTAIGKELIARGALTKDNVSMQSIAAWLRAHPGEADEIMNKNRSYVFFESGSAGAKGAEGVVLTPGRSLAIDHGLLPYGLPLWLTTENPGLQRLMMAQDTGGAIKGPVRGDVFWGYGARAEEIAGPMKSVGRYWVLVPKT